MARSHSHPIDDPPGAEVVEDIVHEVDGATGGRTGRDDHVGGGVLNLVQERLAAVRDSHGWIGAGSEIGKPRRHKRAEGIAHPTGSRQSAVE